MQCVSAAYHIKLRASFVARAAYHTMVGTAQEMAYDALFQMRRLCSYAVRRIQLLRFFIVETEPSDDCGAERFPDEVPFRTGVE
jgi:hypothetical protein